MFRTRRKKAKKNYSRKSSAYKQLRMESLEQKNLLASDFAVSASDFAVSVVGGDLIIDNINQQGGFDQVIGILDGAVSGEFLLGSSETILFTDSMGVVTTVPPETFFTVSGVTRDVIVDLGDFAPGILVPEADVNLQILGATLPGDLRVTGANLTNGDVDGGHGLTIGAGGINNTVTTIAGDVVLNIESTLVGNGAFAVVDIRDNTVIGGDILIDTTVSSNPDFINIEDVTIGGDLRLTLGRSNNPLFQSTVNEVTITSAQVGNDLFVQSGLGNRDLIIDSTTVGDDLVLAIGDTVATTDDGGNTVTVSSTTVGDDVRVTDGLISNSYTLEDVTIDDDLRIDAGAGGIEFIISAINIADDLIFKGGDGDDIFFFESVGVTNIIGDDLYATGRAGADEIGIEDVQIADKLRISTGSGDDFVGIVNSTIGRSALVSLGSGINESEIEGVDAGRSLTVLGRGTNTISLTDVTSTYFVTILTASGDDVVEMTGVTTHSALISTKAGMDEVTITDSTFDYLFVLLGSGDDSLTLDGVTVNRFAFLNGGSGDDTLIDVGDASDINFEIDFAFETIGT
ncbi:MAG: hypothetical protein GXP24_13185 [Planctomycetes bacterium]|nr:hypothetical protein [Planctomycetota bacterium]